jgi:hypothetical protein
LNRFFHRRPLATNRYPPPPAPPSVLTPTRVYFVGFWWTTADNESGKINDWRTMVDTGGRAKTSFSTEHLTLTTVLTTAPPDVRAMSWTAVDAEPE